MHTYQENPIPHPSLCSPTHPPPLAPLEPNDRSVGGPAGNVPGGGVLGPDNYVGIPFIDATEFVGVIHHADGTPVPVYATRILAIIPQQLLDALDGLLLLSKK